MRPSSLTIVAAVAALTVFAAVDALRGSSALESRGVTTVERELSDRGEPPIEGRNALSGRLRAAGVAGTLFVTDDDCRLRALSLPTLKWLLDSGSSSDECEFSVAPDSRHVVRYGGGVAWSPNGRVSASCDHDSVRVYGRTGQQLYEILGHCAPAWKPDGALTLGRSGALVVFRRLCEKGRRACERVLLSPSDLEPALRAGSTPARSLYAPSIRQAIWLTETRVALIVRTRVREQPGGEMDLLVIFEGRELVREPIINTGFDELSVSPSRRYLAVHGSSFRGLSFVDADGNLLARNPIASGHHVAWSPDETWTAVATGGSLYLFRTVETARFDGPDRPLTIRIPLYAADLGWR